MSKENKKLTIVGAMGKLAIPVINRLFEKNVKIKAIVRDVEKAKKILPESVEVVYGDVSDIF